VEALSKSNVRLSKPAGDGPAGTAVGERSSLLAVLMRQIDSSQTPKAVGSLPPKTP